LTGNKRDWENFITIPILIEVSCFRKTIVRLPQGIISFKTCTLRFCGRKKIQYLCKERTAEFSCDAEKLRKPQKVFWYTPSALSLVYPQEYILADIMDSSLFQEKIPQNLQKHFPEPLYPDKKSADISPL
jgi:hypothetical protein